MWYIYTLEWCILLNKEILWVNFGRFFVKHTNLWLQTRVRGGKLRKYTLEDYMRPEKIFNLRPQAIKIEICL